MLIKIVQKLFFYGETIHFEGGVEWTNLKSGTQNFYNSFHSFFMANFNN